MLAMQAQSNGIEIEYETFGDPADVPLLLVAGNGAQLVWWHVEFCEGLADRGFYVIRFDNRDCGRSSWIDTEIDVMEAAAGFMQGLEVKIPYTLRDMAADAWGLCDALGLDRVHLFGESMGGMIVQQMAIDAPERVRSLISAFSTTGDPDVGQPTPEALAALLTEAAEGRQGYIDQCVTVGMSWAGSEFGDPDQIAERAALSYDRGIAPQGGSNQLLAVLTAPSRTEQLRKLEVPALVIHGDIDPLIPISGGERTAEALRGSEFLRLEGYGHDFPPSSWATVIHHVTALAARAS